MAPNRANTNAVALGTTAETPTRASQTPKRIQTAAANAERQATAAK